ncbi:TATA box-binding protein-associated factor RNA polymerase I subunit A [Takifugu flavidus]|uniref:RNA polymerase I subunit A n=1 Tax=Takifugu flavidus TaxID=433684 RepID=A0A5C6NMY9_9TELE|nr:TATA box-binding protein-associated factor RNA polymerase I subunit A [Takifugu flavidus]TWW68754.1 RNA polymerase I subunit A [Takifugu flavidus]
MDDLESEVELIDDIPKAQWKKKPKLSLGMQVNETPKETGFHQSTRLCLEQIREAMLHHRWQEAAEYMACYPQILEATTFVSARRDKEVIWRIGTEILHHHPNSKLQDYNIIYERMKHAGFGHYLMISLEHAFHLMINGYIEEAKGQLSIAESWRYGKETAVQHQKSSLIQAYRSLLDYIIWCDKKYKLRHTEYVEPGQSKDMNNYCRQASVNLKEILKIPGVWDPFIISYVEMLVYYDNHEEALTVLTNYAYDATFPPNPNAYVYLYKFLKEHDPSARNLMKVLKKLRVLVPSHELMLEYSSLLLQTEKTSNVQKALRVVLEMLDFACWRSNLDVWKLLKAIIQTLQLQDDWEDVVLRNMRERKDWWPMLHFTSMHSIKDSENPKLLKIKSSLAKILCPDLPLQYTTETDATL